MKKYQVSPSLKGVVQIGDRSYKASQIIVDDEQNEKTTKTIEKLLKLDNSPISSLEDEVRDDRPSIKPLAIEENVQDPKPVKK